MSNQSQGSIRLFRFLGIYVFLHWSWFFVAVYEIQRRTTRYTSILWNVLEYLALFLIVLLHEFGHALACRHVGGQANQIVLWPLGGIAYVSPPERPGATLWSIAAGPLVNVALLPVLGIIWLVSRAVDLRASMPNAYEFFLTLLVINTALLIFNLLPIYPLDGGQILRSLLWFPFGRARSLMIVAIIGFVGVGGLLLLALVIQDIWLGIIAVFILLNCWTALTHARRWGRMAKTQRREGFKCPNCGMPAPRGAFWICTSCHQPFDSFGTNATCPHCWTVSSTIICPECSVAAPASAWSEPAGPQTD